ncbi:NAD(P)-dependent oxidoreductase [Bradyrhizobium sp. Leo121]|uniref:NAD(P)-dependent oxidoreductase n=1 Tax=Bradyrhizobium sp. Leo121 TaxID=1571195 RepID=UPI00102A417F|nr:NAD(P)-dependent oxidoreductase [Bradyrhizobium sp. Leo121]RZN34533.1 6-phosphogluconate dehydrogenase [Bradyrhizobium sp. Leo121]
MRIAIIGLGEVGRCYAAPLHAAGHHLVLYEKHPSAAAAKLAAQCGQIIRSDPDADLGSVEWALSCVTGATALVVAEAFAPELKSGTSIADFTTATPEVKRKAAEAARRHGVRYVDAAIMGAIALSKVRTPLLVAGEGAGDLKELLDPLGGRVKLIASGAAGDAISLKILRSMFTKGIEALAVELLTSAEKQHLRMQLYEQLTDIDEAPLRSFLDMLVRTHVVHAKRRLHEVQDAEKEMASHGTPSVVLGGVATRFERTARGLDRRPLQKEEPSVEDALAWLLTSDTPEINLKT